MQKEHDLTAFKSISEFQDQELFLNERRPQSYVVISDCNSKPAEQSQILPANAVEFSMKQLNLFKSYIIIMIIIEKI